MDKSKSILREIWDNFEEYVCAIALVIMAVVTFVNVFSRKVTWFNMSFSQELVTTMFVWVCCLAAASAFKTDSHMGFAFLTDKLRGRARTIHAYARMTVCIANYLMKMRNLYRIVQVMPLNGEMNILQKMNLIL